MPTMPEDHYELHERLDWVICGGETGPGSRAMNCNWAMNLRDQCQRANVPFFFKKWGSALTSEPAAPMPRQLPRV